MTSSTTTISGAGRPAGADLEIEAGGLAGSSQLLPKKRNTDWQCLAVLALIAAVVTLVGVVLIEGNSSCTRPIKDSSNGLHPSQVNVSIVYYGGELARAGALFRMCDEVPGALCVFESDDTIVRRVSSSNRLASADGNASLDNFAPPVVLDHSNGEHISQSVAATIYLGQKLGFGEGVGDNVAKAVQYLNDLQDLNSECAAIEYLDRAAKWPDFIEGGRLDAWLGNVERSIRGPFYFGEQRTYVDFYLVQVFDWHAIRLFEPLPAAAAKLANYPKINAILSAVRSLESYQRRTEPTLPLPPRYTADEAQRAFALVRDGRV